MRKLFTTKRRIALASLITVAALAGGSAAYAYFTSTGTGTGTAAVGTSSTWTVTETGATGTILPGSGSSVITFNVHNNSTGAQGLTTETAALVSNATTHDAMNGSTDITGCLSAWFNASVTSSVPATGGSVAGGASAVVQVTVTMTDLPTTDQSACKSATPDVTLTVT